jgi:hypothetical protein
MSRRTQASRGFHLGLTDKPDISCFRGRSAEVRSPVARSAISWTALMTLLPSAGSACILLATPATSCLVDRGTLVSVSRNRIDLKLSRASRQLANEGVRGVALDNPPAQSGHSPRIPVHRPRKAQRASLDGDGIVDPARIAMDDLFGQERPAVDQVRLGCGNPSMTWVRRIGVGSVGRRLHLEPIEQAQKGCRDA